MTPREVTAQALDYASWVEGLSSKDIMDKADEYFKNSDSLALEFQKRFEQELPSELNLGHRTLVVAEEIDSVTERIVRYLSDRGVSIYAVTVQHFKDKDGREMLAQVYLIEPEVAEVKSRSASRRTTRNTLTELQTIADENDIGEMFRRMREGTRDMLLARPYSRRIWYAVRLDDGSQRTLLIVRSDPDEENGGLGFLAHVTRFQTHLNVSLEELKGWLPENTREADVTGWSGSSPDERQNALGLTGSFQNLAEIDRFLNGLRSSSQG